MINPGLDCLIVSIVSIASFSSLDNVLKNEIAKSYKRCVAIAQKVGFSQMTDFDYLTSDKKVQKTTFANEKSVIANFSEQPFTLPNGVVVAPWSAKLQ